MIWVNVMMLIGAAIWLTAELWGAFVRKQKNDTTSEFVWSVQRRWPRATRVVLAVFLLWLSIHLLFEWHLP